MVEKFNDILKKIIAEKGSVLVFAIIKMDEIIDKWLIIFSANWVTTENSTETFNYLRNIIISSLTADEVNLMSGLGIYTKDEHLIQLMTKSISVQDGDVYLKDTALNGYKIHEAHIFQSKIDIDNEVVFQKV
jgi:hypothetical protein